MNKAEAGRLGGLATARKYGKDHMIRIGQKGAYKFWSLYKLLPVDVVGYAIVSRRSNEIIGFTIYAKVRKDKIT